MKNRMIYIVGCILILLVVFIFFQIFNKKNNKKVNNVNNKSIQEMESYLLNINSYKAKIDVTINSNKNVNNYKLIQEVRADYEKQVIIEPAEIANMEIVFDNNTLEIKNSKLNLSKIYNSYPYISNNMLFLTDFIKEYKKAEIKDLIEEEDVIKLQISDKNSRYSPKKELDLRKDTLKPESIKVIDINNNVKVYILYNEIEINNY